MKNLRKAILIFAISFLTIMGIESREIYASDDIAYGADIGWLNQLENEGVTWVDNNGNQKDALQLLKDKGIDAVPVY